MVREVFRERCRKDLTDRWVILNFDGGQCGNCYVMFTIHELILILKFNKIFNTIKDLDIVIELQWNKYIRERSKEYEEKRI